MTVDTAAIRLLLRERLENGGLSRPSYDELRSAADEIDELRKGRSVPELSVMQIGSPLRPLRRTKMSRTTSTDELKRILDQHKLWRETNGAKGARADLDGANLAGANLAGANLAGANLAGANLAGANLDGANLDGANLDGANLDGANLDGANLARAYLAGANLDGANLDGANLARAYLAGANLAGANLDGANLDGANLDGANLDGAYLDGAYLPAGVTGASPTEPYVRGQAPDYEARALRYRERHPGVPVVPHLDAVILGALETGGTLKMDSWHTCATTHCRAGWAITLAGEAGQKLEREYGPERAGGMIYKASTGRIPHFFATNEDALADIKECAARFGGGNG